MVIIHRNSTHHTTLLTRQLDYRRLVLFLFHKSQEFSLLLASGDLSSALQKLRDNPAQDKTPENVSVVNHILKHAYAQQHEKELSAVADYAVLWKDVDVWKPAIGMVVRSKRSAYGTGPFALVGKENILKACGTFRFNDIQATYVLSPCRWSSLTLSYLIRLTAILDSGATFQDQMEAMKVLRTGSSEENVTKWCDERMSLILTSLQKINLSVDDAPALLSVIADRGLTVLTGVLVHLFTSSPFVA